MIKKIVYAFRFMTILPLPWRENEDMVEVSRSSGYFPFVGLVIGLIMTAFYPLGMLFFSGTTTAFIQMILWVLLTGGLHLDGLSDTCDGIGSRQNRERTLEIMKDSRMGAFGTLSLILQLGAKFILILEINSLAPILLIIPPVLGRWGQLIAIYFYPSARPNGMGKFFKDHMRKIELYGGLGFTGLICFTLASYGGLILILAHSLIIWLVMDRIAKKLGGLTGDVYGLVCEVGESITLLMIPITMTYIKLSSPFF